MRSHRLDETKFDCILLVFGILPGCILDILGVHLVYIWLVSLAWVACRFENEKYCDTTLHIDEFLTLPLLIM
jgi:hypothetical protein